MDTLLKTLADNPQLLEAVKKAVLEKFSLLHLKASTPQTMLGEEAKALLTGVEKVEEAFRDIQKLKSAPNKPEYTNPAR